MATSNCDDCTFFQHILYWLLFYSWHWILFIVYVYWWETSTIPETRHLQPELGQNAIYWLEKRGHLRSQTDARRLFIFHLVLLALAPIEGYWVLTSWYRTFLEGSRLEVPDRGDFEGHFAKYLSMVLLPIGMVGFVVLGIMLVLYILLHVSQLWAWQPKKGKSSAEV